MIFKQVFNLSRNLLSCHFRNILKPALLVSVEKPSFDVSFRCLANSSTQNAQQIKKAPRGPYMIFSNVKMEELRAANPGLKIPELGKMIGKLWREMTDKDKMIYKEKYLIEKEKFNEMMKHLSDDEKKQMKDEKKEKRMKKHAKKIKALKKKLGKPKPSDTNPYILFAKSKMLERGDANLNMYVQGVSDFWKKMPEEDKSPFVEQAKKNSLKYRKELAEWEKEMINSGHEELVSKAKLKAIARRTRPKVIKARTKKTVPKTSTKKLSVKKTVRKRGIKSKNASSTTLKSHPSSKTASKSLPTSKKSVESKSSEKTGHTQTKSEDKSKKDNLPDKPKKP